ncbi:MAG: TlpA disulfide reductase family protein [bacterium]|nr:TlpA disulfide reductase family protein [bacterium]MDT8367204.1 TlpA disulfide reductase family protein [bacterium]
MPTTRIKARQVLPILMCLFIALGVTWGASGSYAADKADILESKILKVGEAAPVFVTKNLQGGDFSLNEHIGKKPVILFFWSFFCGPCREEMPILQKIYEDFGKDKVLFVGINLDGPKLGKAIEKFMTDSSLDFTMVFDELNGLEYKIADPYGVAGTPTVYTIDLEGKISFSAVGKVEPPELIEALEQSMTGS